MPLSRSIVFLLPEPEIGGGTLAVLRLAALASQLGFEVWVSGRGPLPPELCFEEEANRFPLAATCRAASFQKVRSLPGQPGSGGKPPILGYRYLDRSRESLPPSATLWVATFWTTLVEARALGVAPLVHFCQGYEGEIPHFAADREPIEAAYREIVPTWTVSPRLSELLSLRFSRPTKVLPPPLPAPLPIRASCLLAKRKPQTPARVALFGAFEAEVKGVLLGLEAARDLVRRGIEIDLLRISVLPLNPNESLLFSAKEYRFRIPPAESSALLASSDLLLFPVALEEGFGLPLLEAMALGVPAIASRTPTTEFIAGEHGARLVERTAGAVAEAASEVLLNPSRWKRLRWCGWIRAHRFASWASSRRLTKAVAWALSVSRRSCL